jgi:DNA-binding MarR family transcriptional regulator
MAICKSPGCSQEELARELCINKSTVARNLSVLEEKGFVTRVALENDKRQLSVRPTERMLSVLPEIKRVSLDWMTLLAEGIPDGELEVFTSVLQRMEQRARRISEGGEEKR